MQPLAEILLRNAGLAFGRPMVRSCSELADLCEEPQAPLLRLVCGDTCGCTDPTSSPWHKAEARML